MEHRRSHKRSEIRMWCPCRTLDGVPLEIELFDLSESGCRARSIGFALHVGQALRLFPEGCDAFTATVRRCMDDLVGIEFDRELPHTVFERMRTYAPPPEEQGDAPPDEMSANPERQGEPHTAASEQELAPVSRVTAQSYGSLLDAGKDKPRKKMAIS